MRLINLDEKIFVPIVDEQIGASYEVQMTVAEMFDRFFEGNKPNIVSAIPVEWLNNECDKADNRGDTELTDAISWLIQTWQEDNNGNKTNH